MLITFSSDIRICRPSQLFWTAFIKTSPAQPSFCDSDHSQKVTVQVYTISRIVYGVNFCKLFSNGKNFFACYLNRNISTALGSNHRYLSITGREMQFWHQTTTIILIVYKTVQTFIFVNFLLCHNWTSWFDVWTNWIWLI